MPNDEKAKLVEKTEQQTEELKRANPDADVKVDNRKDGNVEVNEVRVSTERKG